MNQRVNISGEIFVDNITYEEICDYVNYVISNKANSFSPHFIFAQNPFKVAMASKNSVLMNALRSADILIPDGVGITIAARLKKIRLKQRVTGVDLMYRLMCLSNDKGYTVYFLGGKPGVAEQAIINLKAKFPNLNVVGSSDGYFSEENTTSVIEKINYASPDILFVCMGSPLQEIFLYSNKSRINVPVCMGGGGSLDIYAGNIKRAPIIIQKIGLEWLYRLLKEPRRFNRFVFGYSKFFSLLIKHAFTRSKISKA